MGETTDGSSGAAHGAHHDTEDEEQSANRGFFGRIFGGFAAPEDEGDEDEDSDGGPEATQAVRPGLSNLRRLRVEDVSIPAVEIVSVRDDIARDELVAVFRDSGMTRLPVYHDTLDHPVGMIHLKDFALQFGFNGEAGEFDIRSMLRPLIYAPPSMPIGVLLQKMQSDRIHMALVIDEYGGVDGLLTIEDLIEQVVGEIEDEHDIEDAQLWTLEKPGSYLALARTPLDEFEAEIGRKLVDPEDEEEIDTLGGVVFVLTGRVPTRGEVIPHPDGLEFEIVDADPRRIKRLRVRLPEAAGA
ncbi:HlyC/CorC family transporter [Mesobaculum littorinae]|uniref:HlyC/CorC family transporter n=1 Tax=Mesobaculum littorinae TaxID=2486419 RepID=A0A438AF23_9RHOB|nr:hemolysin family protein [Mesobaculum littorinae]RVV97278.1 HlyC/CorC family transporter [Mesobaculum littorinae]